MQRQQHTPPMASASADPSRSEVFRRQRADGGLKQPIKLYYNYSLGNESFYPGTSFNFETDPSGAGIYRGTSVRPMSNSDFSYPSRVRFVISFIGSRFEATEPVTDPEFGFVPGQPACYDEFVTIRRVPKTTAVQPPGDSIQARALYFEEASGSGQTQSDFVSYTVLSASGMFEGAKVLNINFDNNAASGRAERVVTIF